MAYLRSWNCVACLVLALLTGGARAEEVTEHLEAIRVIMKEREKNGMCGVLLIRAGNEDLLHEAYGHADREGKRPMTVETAFCIGSLVKPITATAIFKLEQDGKLSTSDPLSKFFPDVPEDKRDITVNELLRHRAGFADIFGDDYDVVTRDWFLDKALHSQLIGKPGEKQKYSNAGYSLLAVIIEVVSGQPYEAYINQHVFKPAGTPEIGYVIPQRKNEQLAVGYRGSERWGTPLDHPWAEDGPSWNLRGNGACWRPQSRCACGTKPSSMARSFANSSSTPIWHLTVGVRGLLEIGSWVMPGAMESSIHFRKA